MNIKSIILFHGNSEMNSEIFIFIWERSQMTSSSYGEGVWKI